MRSLFRIVRSAGRLETRELTAALRALGWLTMMRVAVRVVPYATVARIGPRIRPRHDRPHRLTPHQCRRAIERAARVIPGAACLPRALAADCLLRREGHVSTLSLGVVMGDDRQLRAHAWVDSGGVRVAGGDEAAQYRPLAARPEP